MKDILKTQPKKDPDEKVFNFIDSSESATFYDQFYGSYERKEKPELLDQVKQAHREAGTAYKIMDRIMSFLEKELSKDAVVIELGGGMYQQRSANAYNRFPNYYPLDIGYSNIKNYAEKYNREGIVADATSLPFRDGTVDCIITHTFLEHPLQPEKVVAEITRVLKPGGIVVHNDAWFCRWWQRYGVVDLKKFSNMSIKEKAIWFGAKITEFPLFRHPPVILRRAIKHVFDPRPKNIDLAYSKLKPNYTLHLGCDEDAASRIDPVDVIRFYESRNFELVHKLSTRERLLYPNKYIMLRKKAAGQN
jgi:ubiquinone/menaquinone biosynthesis C-methylase UbiE